MVSSLPVPDDKGNRALDPAQGGPRLRDKFRESGLYRNNGSSQPLWPIPFVDAVFPTHLAPDGTYVVIGAEPCSMGGHAATIFATGRQVVTLSKQDLVSCYRSKQLLAALCQRASVDPIRGELDHEHRTYTITTTQGEVFELDVTNGRVLRHASRWPCYVVSFVLLVPTAVVLIWYRPGIRSLMSRAGWKRSRHETSWAWKPTWTRFSLRSLLVGVTLVCVIVAFRELTVLGAFLGTAAAMAGVVAIFFRRSFRSFFIGGVLGCYGCILACVLGDFVGQSLFPDGLAHAYILLLAPFGGLLLGAILARVIERKYGRGERKSDDGQS